MAKKPPKMRTREISRVKGTPAAILGRINAPDAETAVKEWIEKFGITDPEQEPFFSRCKFAAWSGWWPIAASCAAFRKSAK